MAIQLPQTPAFGGSREAAFGQSFLRSLNLPQLVTQFKKSEVLERQEHIQRQQLESQKKEKGFQQSFKLFESALKYGNENTQKQAWQAVQATSQGTPYESGINKIDIFALAPNEQKATLKNINNANSDFLKSGDEKKYITDLNTISASTGTSIEGQEKVLNILTSKIKEQKEVESKAALKKTGDALIANAAKRKLLTPDEVVFAKTLPDINKQLDFIKERTKAKAVTGAKKLTTIEAKKNSGIMIANAFKQKVLTEDEAAFAKTISDPGKLTSYVLGKEKQRDKRLRKTGLGLSATERKEIARGETIVQHLDGLESMFDDKSIGPTLKNYMGPVEGRKSQVKFSYLGGESIWPGTIGDLPPKVMEAMTSVAVIKNAILKALSESQVTTSEADRIENEIPTFADNPALFMIKLNASRKNRIMLSKNIKKAARENVGTNLQNVESEFDAIKNDPNLSEDEKFEMLLELEQGR